MKKLLLFLILVFALSPSAFVWAYECTGSGCATGSGYVTVIFDDGEKYVGETKDYKFHGQGTYTYAGGEKYVGEWKDDNKHGQGIYTYADGAKYVGEFKDNLYHGQGTARYADGSIYHSGEWKDDEPVY